MFVIAQREFQIEEKQNAFVVVDTTSPKYKVKPELKLVSANDALHALFIYSGINEERIQSVHRTYPGLFHVFVRSQS